MQVAMFGSMFGSKAAVRAKMPNMAVKVNLRFRRVLATTRFDNGRAGLLFCAIRGSQYSASQLKVV
jgi:hypothetical protein